MPKLTLEDLAQKPAGTIIGSDVITDPRLHKNEVRWVAVIRGNRDWCIYYHFSSYGIDYIRRSGDKMFTKELIRELVPCTDEAFNQYAF